MISNNYNIVNKSIGFGNQTTNPNCSAQKRHSFNSTQKVIAGATIGVTALAMILARKNISSFVKKLFGKSSDLDLPKSILKKENEMEPLQNTPKYYTRYLHHPNSGRFSTGKIYTDSVSFSGIQNQSLEYLKLLQDNSHLEDLEKLNELLKLRGNKKIGSMQLEGAFKRFARKKLSKGHVMDTPEQLSQRYECLGELLFLHRNTEFFTRIISVAQEGAIKGYANFEELIHLAEKPVKKSGKSKLKYDVDFDTFYNHRRKLTYNGAINIVDENFEFLNNVKKMLEEKPKQNLHASEAPEVEIELPKSESIEKPQDVVPTESPVVPKTEQTEPFDGAKALAEYWRLGKEQGPLPKDHFETPEALARWNELDEKLRVIYRQLSQHNVSMTIKKEFSPNPNEQIEEKRHYLATAAQAYASTNEASLLDYLDMFAKYGDRSCRNKMIGCNTIRDLTGNVSGVENTNKTLEKFIDIMDHIAENDKDEYRDAVRMVFIVENNIQVMEKKTILKAIKVAKRISFQLVDAEDLEKAVAKTQFKDDKEVLSALEDLEAHLKSKNYPYRDRTQND